MVGLCPSCDSHVAGLDASLRRFWWLSQVRVQYCLKILEPIRSENLPLCYGTMVGPNIEYYPSGIQRRFSD